MCAIVDAKTPQCYEVPESLQSQLIGKSSKRVFKSASECLAQECTEASAWRLATGASRTSLATSDCIAPSLARFECVARELDAQLPDSDPSAKAPSGAHTHSTSAIPAPSASSMPLASPSQDPFSTASASGTSFAERPKRYEPVGYIGSSSTSWPLEGPPSGNPSASDGAARDFKLREALEVTPLNGGPAAHFCCVQNECVLKTVPRGTQGCTPIRSAETLSEAESRCALQCTRPMRLGAGDRG